MLSAVSIYDYCENLIFGNGRKGPCSDRLSSVLTADCIT